MDVITIPMTPDQFEKAKEALNMTDVQGTVKTSQLDFDYSYDSTKSECEITILAKHGFAKFASDDTIKSHIEGMLA